jgi:hypothetical protein
MLADIDGPRWTSGDQLHVALDDDGCRHVAATARGRRGSTALEGSGGSVHRVGSRVWRVPATGFWQSHRDAPALYSELVRQWAADTSAGSAAPGQLPQRLLAARLVHCLLTGGQAVVAEAHDAAAALDGLIEFHLDFALDEPDLIRIQDRDLANLPAPAQRQVRRAQRRYVETWVNVLRDVNPRLDEDGARVMAHAAFGLLNSTPHSVRTAGRDQSRAVLRAMTAAALSVDTGEVRKAGSLHGVRRE